MENYSWHAAEYIHKEKTADWYWIVGAVSVSIAIISIILGNLIFGLLVLISSFTLSLFASRKPEIIFIEIENSGIMIGKTFHPYSETESFWVETRDSYPRIFFKSKKKLSLYTVVMLGNADSDVVRQILSQHLPEVEHTEPLLEKVLLYLGF